ncbi:MAG TPA: flagellar protein FliT [Rhodanobacteraceae bacterium]|nr:flagellar protein FliT [Rhodanobacteraceae bacterium]
MIGAWSAILDLTTDMLSAARNGDFDRVGALDIERRALLDVAIATDGGFPELLARIVACDRELVALIAAERAHAAERLRQARLAQAGAGTYLGVAFAR